MGIFVLVTENNAKPVQTCPQHHKQVPDDVVDGFEFS